MKKDRCMCVMQIIQRSFNFLKSYRFFGDPLLIGFPDFKCPPDI